MMTTASAMVQVTRLKLPEESIPGKENEPSGDEIRWETYDDGMGFGHIYVKADPEAVAALIGRHLGEKGFEPVAMTPELHPKRMKEMHENQMRLYWLSPRLG